MHADAKLCILVWKTQGVLRETNKLATSFLPNVDLDKPTIAAQAIPHCVP